MTLLEAEIACQTTTSGVEDIQLNSGIDKQLPVLAAAVLSWPVEIHVSPQHTVRRGTSTANPADSSTATAALPTSGSKLLTKVSGQSSTRPRAAGVGADRRW
ncbi:hypothetical protein [Candidatus Mycobacterium methanotrophicum]|uniref:Uncharacterized protein n=1 Tax=Candidatus Mycobacterium methanotrophicum TaxID=2943498 RepID=A0ABY4QG54_9MYCO|nr:hypothetical protein [Candidatus Mycobacterium methanotrophicum]UQX09943.1 hypothetical protein M5I08_17090 [Candidatus Mycobacterium methanotrophicum]